MSTTQPQRKELLDEINDREPYVTQFEDNIICPYCGYEVRDSWELGGGGEHDDSMICDACAREFEWSRILTAQYSTRRIGGDGK